MAELTLEDRKRLYNLCNPQESLDSTDARLVILDERMTHGRVRGEDWRQRITAPMLLSDGPTLQLFTGLRGSGKSTELRRAAHWLRSAEGGSWLPVIVRADTLIDIGSTIDVPDVLIAIAYDVSRELLGDERALDEGPMKRLWTWLTRTDVSFSKLEVGSKLPIEMKTRATVRQRVRAVVSEHMTTFVQSVCDDIVALDKLAKERGHQGLVIIVDSLEKLQGSSGTWLDVLDSAERMFANDAPYLRLPVHTLFTIPPALAQRLRVNVHFLPMIKLRSLRGDRFDDGFRMARRLVSRRVGDEHLASLFGADYDVRVEELLTASGGYPREIIYLLQSVISSSEGPYDTSDKLHSLLMRLGGPYRDVVYGQGVVELVARIAVEKQLLLNDEQERTQAARLLSENIVLRYANDTQWFDVHPAVLAAPEVQLAIQRIKLASEHPG